MKRKPTDTIAVLKVAEDSKGRYLSGKLDVSPPKGCTVRISKLDETRYALHVLFGWPRGGTPKQDQENSFAQWWQDDEAGKCRAES